MLRGFGVSNLIAKLVKACCATQHAQGSSLCHEGTCLGTEGRDGEQRCKEQPGNQQKGSGSGGNDSDKVSNEPRGQRVQLDPCTSVSIIKAYTLCDVSVQLPLILVSYQYRQHQQQYWCY